MKGKDLKTERDEKSKLMQSLDKYCKTEIAVVLSCARDHIVA